MIIYGTRDVTLQSTSFEDHFCTNCGQKGTICCTVFSRHAHIFWIPLFPYSKRLVIWCNNCKKEFHINELSPQLRSEIVEFHRKCRAPLWQWVGLALIAASVLIGITNGITENKNTKKYFDSPEINDVYCVKYDDGYSLMFIDEIRDDSIFFIHNEYTYSTMTKVKNLHKLNYYDLDEVYGYSREELNELYHEEKFIKKIWRSLPYSTANVKIKESKTIDNSIDDEDFESEEEDVSEDSE